MNLFLPVYKRLEEDVIKLTEQIFFDDKQLSVYSLTAGNLLVRCVIEVEAISKELYIRLGGDEKPKDDIGEPRDLYFDTDCIKLLVDTWDIDKKKLQITSPNMYISKENGVITPLHKAHKRGTSSSKWQQAYQAFKHYRTRSIEKATIENLLNALGALYILNLYYANENFWHETVISDRREYVNESKIFTPFVADATHVYLSSEMGDTKMDPIESPSLQECIFIQKITDTAYRDIHKSFCKYTTNVAIKVQMSDEYKEYISEHPEDGKVDIDIICKRIGNNWMLLMNQEIRVVGSCFHRLKEKEIVLNKNMNIYPTLTYESFMSSEEGQKYRRETIASLKGKKIVLK